MRDEPFTRFLCFAFVAVLAAVGSLYTLHGGRPISWFGLVVPAYLCRDCAPAVVERAASLLRRLLP
jgi:hypothetical protein